MTKLVRKTTIIYGSPMKHKEEPANEKKEWQQVFCVILKMKSKDFGKQKVYKIMTWLGNMEGNGCRE